MIDAKVRALYYMFLGDAPIDADDDAWAGIIFNYSNDVEELGGFTLQSTKLKVAHSLIKQLKEEKYNEVGRL